MEYLLRSNARYATDEDLISDLERVHAIVNKSYLGQRDYNPLGKYTHKTFVNRFGSWNNALAKAGLQIIVRKISDDQLFDNLGKIWTELGRQPFYGEIKNHSSKYSVDAYTRRFGGWYKACQAFIRYKGSDPQFVKFLNTGSTERTRTISYRSRLKVFKRDNYHCVICGKSPSNEVGVVLHVDHIKPFSLGGSNEISNLRTLCSQCNLSRGNTDL